MIRHYVIFTFEDNFFTEEHLKEYRRVFDDLVKEVPGVKAAQVHENSVDRPANMDLMVILDLEDESVLPRYLSHPKHAAMGEKYNPHVTKRVSFDHIL